MKTYCCYKTDIGNIRKINQDAVCLISANESTRNGIFAVVCDGVGGLQKGEYASRETLEGLKEWFQYEYPQIKQMAAEEQEETLELRMKKNMQEQNQKLYDYGNYNKIRLGTTATALLLENREYHIIHVGDSRVYEIEEHVLQITEDHSLLAQEVRAGRLTIQEAKYDKRSNVLLQSVGYKNEVIPFYAHGKTKLATYLVCSDGFFRKLKEEELLELAPKHIGNDEELESVLLSLIERSKQRGETDNLSVAAVVVKDRRDTI